MLPFLSFQLTPTTSVIGPAARPSGVGALTVAAPIAPPATVVGADTLAPETGAPSTLSVIASKLATAVPLFASATLYGNVNPALAAAGPDLVGVTIGICKFTCVVAPAVGGSPVSACPVVRATGS